MNNKAVTIDPQLYYKLLRELEKTQDENRELKRALDAAVAEIRGCDKCAHGEPAELYPNRRIYKCACGEFNYLGYKGGSCKGFKWKHAEKYAEKIVFKYCGMWERKEFGRLACSICGAVQEDDAHAYPFCPACGARMNGGKENAAD